MLFNLWIQFVSFLIHLHSWGKKDISDSDNLVRPFVPVTYWFGVYSISKWRFLLLLPIFHLFLPHYKFYLPCWTERALASVSLCGTRGHVAWTSSYCLSTSVEPEGSLTHTVWRKKERWIPLLNSHFRTVILLQQTSNKGLFNLLFQPWQDFRRIETGTPLWVLPTEIQSWSFLCYHPSL